MSQDGFVQALAQREAAWAAQVMSTVEVYVVEALKQSASAEAEWDRLARPGTGRWAKIKASPRADHVLGMIIRSATLACGWNDLLRLGSSLEAEYRLLNASADNLFKYYLSCVGLTHDEFEALGEAELKSIAARSELCSAAAIFDNIIFKTTYDLGYLSELAQPNLHITKGVEARTFVYLLAVGLHDAYCRPFQEFVVWATMELFPASNPPDATTVSRYLANERRRRSKFVDPCTIPSFAKLRKRGHRDKPVGTSTDRGHIPERIVTEYEKMPDLQREELLKELWRQGRMDLWLS